MAHKVLPSPTSGADTNFIYGSDWNKLINSLNGTISTDPFTLNIDWHTLKHSTTNVAGDLIKSDGTRFNRLAKGTALQELRVNSAGTDLEYHSNSVYNNQDNTFGNNEIQNARGFMGDIFNGYAWGAYYPTANATDIGILNGTTTSGTQTNGEDADGYFRQFASGTTAGTVVGKRKTDVWCRRSQNCFFQARFNVSHATADIRHCHGFTTSTAAMGNDDTFLASGDSGVMVGFRTTDTNWMVFNNDGTGAMVATSLGVAKDTATHKVDIRAIAANNSFVVRFDAVTPVVLTTRIPAATTPLTVRHQAINATATDINLKMRGILVGTRFI